MIKIRKAELKDIKDLKLLWEEFVEEHDRILMKQSPRLKQFIARKKTASTGFANYARKKIKASDSIIYIAEDDNIPVGLSLVL